MTKNLVRGDLYGADGEYLNSKHGPIVIHDVNGQWVRFDLPGHGEDCWRVEYLTPHLRELTQSDVDGWPKYVRETHAKKLMRMGS